MRYSRAYRYFFDSPKWGTNLLLGSVCVFIPVLGSIVFSGYGFEAVETMHGQGSDRTYPDFDFNRFVKYLVRGCWPFIWQLIIGVPVGFVFAILCLLGTSIAIAASGGHDPNPAVFFIIVILLVLIGLAVGLLISLVQIPLTLRAGLSQELGFEGAFAFVQDFLQRVWKEVLLAQLFMMVTGIPLILLAELLCIIPVFPASVLVMMAQYHLMYQVYELYLQRGGTVIPIKLETAPL